MTTTNVTDVLAGFASSMRASDLPTIIVDRVKAILLDTLASALAGLDADETDAIRNCGAHLMGSGDSTTIGGAPMSLAGATMVNGYLVTAVTVCDVHRPTLCHVTPEVIPPALAISEQLHSSGEELLAAVAAGLEVTTRVGLGINYAEFRARGWHSPGVIGPFGSAAAVGNLRHLSRTEMRHAFGIAGSQSAGSFAQLGTGTIKFTQARGALSGLLAATLAADGFTATPDILLAQDGGIYRTHSDGGTPERAVDDLGGRWELANISLRPWPVAAYLQSVVSVLLAALDAHPAETERISLVRLRVSPAAYRLHGNIGFEDKFRAKLSARYVAAVVIADRACWLEQFSEARVADPALASFATDRVTVQSDETLGDIAAAIDVVLDDGSTFSAQSDVPKGDSADPLSRQEVIAKFRTAAASSGRDYDVEGIIGFVSELEKEDDAGQLVGMMAGV